MEKISEWFLSLWDNIPLILIVGVIVVILGIGWIFIASFGFLGGLLFLAAVGLAVMTYQTTTFVGSVAVGILLKMLLMPIMQLTAIWFAGQAHTQFFNFVAHQNTMTIIAILFFFGYVLNLGTRTISSVLGSIKLVTIVNN